MFDPSKVSFAQPAHLTTDGVEVMNQQHSSHISHISHVSTGGAIGGEGGEHVVSTTPTRNQRPDHSLELALTEDRNFNRNRVVIRSSTDGGTSDADAEDGTVGTVETVGTDGGTVDEVETIESAENLQDDDWDSDEGAVEVKLSSSNILMNSGSLGQDQDQDQDLSISTGANNNNNNQDQGKVRFDGDKQEREEHQAKEKKEEEEEEERKSQPLVMQKLSSPLGKDLTKQLQVLRTAVTEAEAEAEAPQPLPICVPVNNDRNGDSNANDKEKEKEKENISSSSPSPMEFAAAMMEALRATATAAASATAASETERERTRDRKNDIPLRTVKEAWSNSGPNSDYNNNNTHALDHDLHDRDGNYDDSGVAVALSEADVQRMLKEGIEKGVREGVQRAMEKVHADAEKDRQEQDRQRRVEARSDVQRQRQRQEQQKYENATQNTRNAQNTQNQNNSQLDQLTSDGDKNKNKSKSKSKDNHKNKEGKGMSVYRENNTDASLSPESIVGVPLMGTNLGGPKLVPSSQSHMQFGRASGTHPSLSGLPRFAPLVSRIIGHVASSSLTQMSLNLSSDDSIDGRGRGRGQGQARAGLLEGSGVADSGEYEYEFDESTDTFDSRKLFKNIKLAPKMTGSGVDNHTPGGGSALLGPYQTTTAGGVRSLGLGFGLWEDELGNGPTDGDIARTGGTSEQRQSNNS